jgi:HTH-type transcriptional regulator / antitoxin HipB
MNTMQTIGLTIRNARKNLQLTQAVLAAELGMSRATLSAIETGHINEVGIRKVIALCARLNLDLIAVQSRPYPTLKDLRDEQRK